MDTRSGSSDVAPSGTLYCCMERPLVSNAIPLDPNAIKALLGREERQQLAPQVGPIKWYDKEMRCSSRGCSSPTYIKWLGMPKCTMHVLKAANELLLDLGIDV